jgi:glycine betaine/proline transport system substrate-binding protein
MSAVALVVAGCGGRADSGSKADSKDLTFGEVTGWTDQTGTSALIADILNKNGYKVDVKALSDNAPNYTGLANGDIDVITSAWPERTQKSYMDKYGKDIEDLGTYYDAAQLFMAVPTYSKVKSIADLDAKASEFDGKVIGIEPGAGLTKITQDAAFPDYGLNKDFKLVLSSTTAMLTQLKKATEAKQEIVVTLWKPFWANQKFPVRPLQDPKGAYGKPERLHSLAHKGFSKAHPEVANMLAHFKMTDQQYGTLEDMVVNKYGQGKEDQAAAAWLKQNPDFETNLEKYLKS